MYFEKKKKKNQHIQKNHHLRMNKDNKLAS